MPSPAVLPPSKQSQSIDSSVSIVYEGTGPKFHPLIGAKANVPWLEATLAPATQVNAYRLTLHKLADEAPVGNLSATVTVTTDDTLASPLLIPVKVPVDSDLRAKPNPLVLPTVRLGETSKGHLQLTGWTSTKEPIVRLSIGASNLIIRTMATLDFEVAIKPRKLGMLTQTIQIYDGESLQAEVPVLVRVEP
jgi:hypothetical protein